MSLLFADFAAPSVAHLLTCLLECAIRLTVQTCPWVTTRSVMENRKAFFGDSKLCYKDSCEFFVLCWMTGGLIQKSCGGFLFACCHRPGRSPEPLTPYADSLEHPDMSYGAVRSDPRT